MMKKFKLFVLPLLAIPFLANCKESDPAPKTSYNLSCGIIGASSTIILVKGEKNSTAYAGDAIKITARVDKNYLIPIDAEKAATKITAAGIDLTAENFKIDNKSIVVTFNMPENDVKVTGKLDLASYDLSCVITGTTSTIKVNGIEAESACIGDEIIITAQVNNGYVFPTSKGVALNKITSEDITLTEDNINIDTVTRIITISFNMPGQKVTISGSFDNATIPAYALPNTSLTTTYHGHVEISDGPKFDVGSDVTCTIKPDNGFICPNSIDNIKFFTDEDGQTPLSVAPEVTYTSGQETFTFKMPNSKVYVAVICSNHENKKVININVIYETTVSFVECNKGTPATITFTNPANGYRLSKDKEEFLNNHQISANEMPEGDNWFTYAYTEAHDEESEMVVLTISSVNTNFIITGSAIPISQ